MKNLLRGIALSLPLFVFLACEDKAPDTPEQWTPATDYYDEAQSEIVNAYSDGLHLTTITKTSMVRAAPNQFFSATYYRVPDPATRYGRMALTPQMGVFPLANGYVNFLNRGNSGLDEEALFMSSYDSEFEDYDFPTIPGAYLIACNENMQCLIPYKQSGGHIITEMLLVSLGQNFIPGSQETMIEVGSVSNIEPVANFVSFFTAGENFIINTLDEMMVVNSEGNVASRFTGRLYEQVFAYGDMHYALADDNKLYKSTDNGVNWDLVGLQQELEGKQFVQIGSHLLAFAGDELYDVNPSDWSLSPLYTEGLEGTTITDVETLHNRLFVTTYTGAYMIGLDRVLD